MSDLGNRKIFSRNVSKYLDLNHITQKELCKALSFSESTFSDWINAKSYPRIDKIEKMANYFGISKAELIEAEKPNDFILSPFEKQLLISYRSSDKMTQEMVCRILGYEELLEKKKKAE